MNVAVVAAAVGIVNLVFGMAGLFYPERVMGLVGFSVMNDAHAAAAMGEVRGLYGGLFLVMGVYALVAASRPAAYKSVLFFLGFLWLGIFAGRAIGIYLDGNPGLLGWLALAIELAIGGALVGAAVAGDSASGSVSAARPVS